MKKIICIMLSVLLLSSAFPFVAAFAESEKKQISDYEQNYNVFYHYDKATKTLTLSGEGAYETEYDTGEGGIKFEAFYPFAAYKKTAEKIVIEEGITKIAGASFAYFKNLKSVKLPSTLKEIEPYAFYECYKLSNINLPYSLEKIGYEAFRSCRKLTLLNIPKDVSSIGRNFILDTPTLKTLTVDEENKTYTAKNNVLYNKDKTSLIASAAKNTSVTIPKTVTNIQDFAFALSNIKKIIIPKTVKDLGAATFYKSKIQTITFEKGTNLDEIKGYYKYYGDEMAECYGMFEDCVYLKKLTIPNSVKTIDKPTISGCKSLEYLYIGKNVKIFGYDMKNELYACKSLKTIKVHKDNKNFYTLNGSLYSKRKSGKSTVRTLIFVPVNKKSINIPKNISTIGSFAFANGKIEKVLIPKNITEIENGAFYNCQKLSTIRFEKGSKLKTLYTNTFEEYYGLCCYKKPEPNNFAIFNNCKKLKKVVFPNSLKATQAPLFENCPSLKSVYFGKNLTEDELSSGYDNYFGYVFKNCKALEKVNISAENKNYKSVDGVVYNKNTTALLYYPQGKKGKTYSVPKTVKSIPYKAVYYPKYLKTLKILNTSKKLTNNMFVPNSFSSNVTLSVKRNSAAHKELKNLKKKNSKIKYKTY